MCVGNWHMHLHHRQLKICIHLSPQLLLIVLARLISLYMPEAIPPLSVKAEPHRTGPELQIEIGKQVLSFQRRKDCVVKNKSKFQKNFSTAWDIGSLQIRFKWL